jgi:sulfite dehydrogenase (cytochrome) subunit B
MTKTRRRIAWSCFGLLLASAAAGSLYAQNKSITLPADNPMSELKPGDSVATVRRNCSVCHSTDYIVRQPPLDAAHWDAEVKKMISVFGARISEPDAKIISAYLSSNYGSK